MRPLPDLSDVGPPGSVFDPQQDDLLAVISQDLGAYNSLVSSLDPQQNDLGASAGGIGSAIDSIDALSDAAGTVFDSLSRELDSIDLTSTIADSLAADSLLSTNLDGFNVDYGTLGFDLLKSVFDVIVAVTKDVINAIIAAINAIIVFLSHLGTSIFLGPPAGVFSGGNFPEPPPVPGF